MKSFVDVVLNEHFAAIVRSSGALWTGHSYVYIQHRAWLIALLEMGAQVPVMQPSKEDLLIAVNDSFDHRPIGRPGEALLCVGKAGTKYHGIEQIWVKARSRHYREAMLDGWSREMRRASTELHLDAVKAYADCIAGVVTRKLRKKLSDKRRIMVTGLLTERLKLHLSAAGNCPDPDLMKDFDCTLHADHIFSASALKNVEDAWVWLFPVPADANQVFGSRVERHYMTICPTTGTRYVASGMIYKLLASSMPREACDVSSIMKVIRGQLSDTPEGLAIFDMVNQFAKQHKTL